MKNFSKKLRHLGEYCLLTIVIFVLRLINFNNATNSCAWLARKIGPHLKVTMAARRNIAYVRDIATSKQSVDYIIEQMWDNLGRFVAEFAYSSKLSTTELSKMIRLTGFEKLHYMCDNTQPFILFTGHFANWDLMLSQLATLNHTINVVYRAANNPYVDKLIRKNRQYKNINLIAKGPKGYSQLSKALRNKQPIVMLVDQKMNEGTKVPFLGKEAMTADAIVRIYRQFNYKLIPAQIIRQPHNSSYFDIIIHDELLPNLPSHAQYNPAQMTHIILTSINNILGEWIKQHPGQWFWLHDRWGINKNLNS